MIVALEPEFGVILRLGQGVPVISVSTVRFVSHSYNLTSRSFHASYLISYFMSLAYISFFPTSQRNVSSK